MSEDFSLVFLPPLPNSHFLRPVPLPQATPLRIPKTFSQDTQKHMLLLVGVYGQAASTLSDVIG